jgi:hypothetical protein
MKRIDWSVAVGIFLFLVTVMAVITPQIILRDYQEWERAYGEALDVCLLTPAHSVNTCKQYADWVTSFKFDRHLNQCIDRYETRQRLTYPSALICLELYDMSFLDWRSELDGIEYY